MLYNLLYPLADDHAIFNLFKYVTFRSMGACFTSLIFSFLLYPPAIKFFIKIQKGGQPIRECGPESHLESKKGTPTMGGVVLLASVTFSSLLWADISNFYLISVLLVTISFGILGFVDDFLKIVKRNSKGVSGKVKFFFQTVICLVACYMIQSSFDPSLRMKLALPFFKDLLIDFGLFFYVFSIFVIVGASNAVNLTDGLDGLAIVPIMICAVCLALIAYLCGHFHFAEYLQIHYIEHAGELAIFCASLVGAGLGFLWYNAPPAQIFMGDTGSLAFGGGLATISLVTKHEIVFAIIGGVFVMETISVIMQVYYFKLTGGKRIFKMTPIHHHFEKIGWSEPKIVIRFWILAIIFAMLGLMTLKLR